MNLNRSPAEATKKHLTKRASDIIVSGRGKVLGYVNAYSVAARGGV